MGGGGGGGVLTRPKWTKLPLCIFDFTPLNLAVSRVPGIAVLGSRLTGLKFFQVIAFAGLARLIKPARVERVISIPYTS